MNPVTQALALVGVLSTLGVTFGFMLAWTSKRLGVAVNPLVDEVEEELPKGQCGSCGFAGCRQYAEAVVLRPHVPANLCTPGGNDVAKLVAKLTGKTAEEVVPLKAVVMCTGVRDETCTSKYIYEGLEDCTAAALLWGGDKACEAGCLGLGTCVRACPHGAMSMNPKTHLPDVDPTKCVGCGVCVEQCPRGVMAMVPEHAKGVIRCRNTEKGALTKKQCQVGCIACGICVRTCPQEAIQVVNNLAVVDAGKCKECQVPVCLVVKCVPKSIQPFYGVSIPNVEPPKPRPVKKDKPAGPESASAA